MTEQSDFREAADGCAKIGCFATAPIFAFAVLFWLRAQWELVLLLTTLQWSRNAAEAYLPTLGVTKLRQFVRGVAALFCGLLVAVAMLAPFSVFRVREPLNLTFLQVMCAVFLASLLGDLIFNWVLPGRKRRARRQPTQPAESE